MAKQSGLGDHLLVGSYDLSGDIGSIQSCGGGQTPLDVTDITQSGYGRLGGLRTGHITFSSWFDKAAGASHPRLSTLPTTDVNVTYCRGYTRGNAAASIVAKQIGYDGTRGQDGSLSFAVDCQSNGYGLAWGQQMSNGLQVATVAGNNTSVDFTAASAFGAVAFLHVTAFTGTSAFIGLDHSSDNGAVDPFAALDSGSLEFAVSGITSARQTTSLITTSVKRYVRLYVSGTFSSVSFLYNLVKFPTSQAV